MTPYWSNGQATIWHANALDLPLADESVDLIVTSPPYFGLRSYRDDGEHYDGQIGSEATPAEFVDALIAATREMVRVLKPSGSIFVNLGDTYAGTGSPYKGAPSTGSAISAKDASGTNTNQARAGAVPGIRAKSLTLIPERYRIACVDQLGLIARAVVVWSKPNGLPESVTDRVRRSHEDWVHLTKQPRYYSAVDEIREAHTSAHPNRGGFNTRGEASYQALAGVGATGKWDGEVSPLGKLPGSVWEIATQPLRVPPELGIDHFAAFPMDWPRRIITGWSPRDVCTACGEGRRPVSQGTKVPHYAGGSKGARNGYRRAGTPNDDDAIPRTNTLVTITGYACACTPYTDHEGTGSAEKEADRVTGLPPMTKNRRDDWVRVGPWREYHFDRWTPPPSTPGVVLDPFGGTGTVSLVASVLGRDSHCVDLSADYCRLAKWRITDPGEIARAMQVEKPPKEIDGQDDLLTLLETDGAA